MLNRKKRFFVKSRENYLKPRVSDFLMALMIAAAAAALFFGFAKPKEQGKTAEIYLGGQLLYSVDLIKDDGKTFKAEGDYTNVIEVSKGKIRVKSSDCPGESCVHTGWIDTEGRSVICLPNKMEIRIVGDGGVDAVVG